MMFDKLKNMKRQYEDRIKEREAQNALDAAKLREIEAAEALITELIADDIDTETPAEDISSVSNHTSGAVQPTNEPTKLCRKCGQIKPLSQFNSDRTKRDGRHTVCAKCHNNNNRRYKQKQKHLKPFPPASTAANAKANTKRCPVCAKVKPVSEFSMMNTARGIRQWACRECYSLRGKHGTWVRRCRTCGETKPLDEFSLNSSSPTGRRYECKYCARENTAKHAAMHRTNSSDTPEGVW